MNGELKKIKKYYGEEMMHLCRELFPTILEEEGALLSILESRFPHSKFLYEDIVKDNKVTEFKDYIYDIYNNPLGEEKPYEKFESPFVLMDRAGYTLYECHTENDIQSFRKYYASGEELCTFSGRRLDNYLVFFAVKKNVKDIKRENFSQPERQDEYGTSVISIQYLRGANNTLSVKNRYNHTVENPDATFSNNLDNIIPGLNESFERTYDLHHTGSNNQFELSKYVMANDGKYYKINYEIAGIYYGPDKIIIDNFEVVEKYLEKEKYLVIDRYVLDLVNKKIFAYIGRDKYIEHLNNINKIDIQKMDNGNRKIITLFMNKGQKVIFEVDRYNQIIRIFDEYTEIIPDDALVFSNHIIELSMPKVMKCGNRFLLNNQVLEKITMPEIRYINDNFLRRNNGLCELDFPKVRTIGNYFIRCNDKIKNINFPQLEVIGDYFIDLNRSIETVSLPNVKSIGYGFLSSNNKIKEIAMPELENALGSFLATNMQIKEISFPKLKTIGNHFFRDSTALVVNLPKVTSIGNNFLERNYQITSISLPEVESVGDRFIGGNRAINFVYMPKLTITGDRFLLENEELRTIYFPMLEECGDDFMMYNHRIENIMLPAIQIVGDSFLLYAPLVRKTVFDQMEEKEAKKLVRKKR